MSRSDNTRSWTDYREERIGRSQRRTREEIIEEALEACSAAYAPSTPPQPATVARQIADPLLPELVGHEGQRLQAFDRLLADHEDWDRQAVETVARRLRQHGDEWIDWLAETGGRSRERQLLKRAYGALAAAAAETTSVTGTVRSRADALGWSQKIGEHIQSPEMDLGDRVRAVTDQSGALKSLFLGGTGQGKSAALETELWDYYCQTFCEARREYKIVDLWDAGDGEAWIHDIPQQDDSLRRARSELSLPETFAADDDLPDPDVEILVPLTPSLADQQLPWDDDAGQFDVRPFTIPASRIRKQLLLAILAERLSPQQEDILRLTYDQLDRRESDWALADLADAIREREEINPVRKQPILNTLQILQQQGFVRTADSDWTIDWRDLFTDTETITVFSQVFLSDEIGQLIVFGHLLDTLARKRDSMYGIPECAVAIRELWKVAPHRLRNAFDKRAAALQSMIGDVFTKIFRENRKSGVHLLCDTQYPSDLAKSIRELFNRYVAFETNRSIAEDLVSWTSNDAVDSFYRTINSEQGHATMIGQVEPAIRREHMEFLGPIQYAPPPWHHFDEDQDANGWQVRAKHLNRDLRTPAETDVEWPTAVPDHLTIDVGEDGDSDDGPDPEMQPVAAFVDRHVEPEPHARLDKDRLAVAFNEFVERHGRDPWDLDDRGVATRFGKAFTDHIDTRTVSGSDGKAYEDCRLAASGEALIDDAMAGIESAAAPVEVNRE